MPQFIFTFHYWWIFEWFLVWGYYNQSCCEYFYMISPGAQRMCLSFSTSIVKFIENVKLLSIVTVSRILWVSNGPHLHSWCVNLSNLDQCGIIIVVSHCGLDQHFPNEIEHFIYLFQFCFFQSAYVNLLSLYPKDCQWFFFLSVLFHWWEIFIYSTYCSLLVTCISNIFFNVGAFISLP